MENISLNLLIEDELISIDSESENNNDSFFSKIFKNPILGPKYEDEDNFLDEAKSKESDGKILESKENSNISKEKTPLFTVIKEEIKDKTVFKKRGRKLYLEGRKKEKSHKFDASDNIRRKINSHFLSFVVLFLNDILSNLNFQQRFINLNYDFKKKATKKDIDYIKQLSIENIICTDISKKYKKLDKSYNKVIYNQIKDNIILKNIFSESYLNLFKKIYHKGNRIINLKEYGLNKKIVLSNKVEMYKDLLLKDEKKDIGDFCRRKYNECIKLNYIPNSIFVSN